MVYIVTACTISVLLFFLLCINYFFDDDEFDENIDENFEGFVES